MSLGELYWAGLLATYGTLRLRSTLPLWAVAVRSVLWPRTVLLWVVESVYDE